MPSKKTVAAKTAAKKATTKTATKIATTTKPGSKSIWTLPLAMVMLVIASAALWLAAREASNAPQAATPAAVPAVVTPDPSAGKRPAPAPPADLIAKPEEVERATAVKPVSVTGCLQRDSDGFVLKNTEGAAAPKARSWKSGFLKRSAASIDLLDAGNAAHLGSHVGQRVSVTGSLVDREMKVQSLHRIAAACQ